LLFCSSFVRAASLSKSTRRIALILVSAVALAIHAVSCTSRPHRAESTVAVVIVMADGGRPSPQVVADVYRALHPHIAQGGHVFAESSRGADYLLHVKFTPDLIDGGGRVSVLTVKSVGPQRSESAQAADQRSLATLQSLERMRLDTQNALRSSGVEPLR
jgi:hypothetical protein